MEDECGQSDWELPLRVSAASDPRCSSLKPPPPAPLRTEPPEERLDKPNLSRSSWASPMSVTSDLTVHQVCSSASVFCPFPHPISPPAPILRPSFQLHGPAISFSPPLRCHPPSYVPTLLPIFFHWISSSHPTHHPSIHHIAHLSRHLSFHPSPPRTSSTRAPLASSALPPSPFSLAPLLCRGTSPATTSFPPSICPACPSTHPSVHFRPVIGPRQHSSAPGRGRELRPNS